MARQSGNKLIRNRKCLNGVLVTNLKLCTDVSDSQDKQLERATRHTHDHPAQLQPAPVTRSDPRAKLVAAGAELALVDRAAPDVDRREGAGAAEALVLVLLRHAKTRVSPHFA